MSFKYEADPDFNRDDYNTWYDGDLIKLKIQNDAWPPQHLFSIIKRKGDNIRIVVNKIGHGTWVKVEEVEWVARPLFPD